MTDQMAWKIYTDKRRILFGLLMGLCIGGLISMFMGCVKTPSTCDEIFKTQSEICANLENPPVPSCPEIFSQEACDRLETPVTPPEQPSCEQFFTADFCTYLADKPANACEYFVDLDATGKAAATVFVCNSAEGQVVYTCTIKNNIMTCI